MARGPRISIDMRKTVAAVYREHRDWEIKEIQAEVDRLTKGRAPGESATQKIVLEVRNREQTSDFLNQDTTWSLGTLDDYPLPMEVIPKLLEIQNHLSPGGITVRCAKWVARLYPLQKDYILLVIAAGAYSQYEERCKLLGQPCDTSDLDALLLLRDGERKVAHLVNTQVHGEGYEERWDKKLKEVLHEDSQENQT